MTGGVRNTYIWQIFTIAIKPEIGPSNVSIRDKAKALSKIPKSFENLFINNPEGVKKKKQAGLRTIPFTIF